MLNVTDLKIIGAVFIIIFFSGLILSFMFYLFCGTKIYSTKRKQTL